MKPYQPRCCILGLLYEGGDLLILCSNVQVKFLFAVGLCIVEMHPDIVL
jgi:hypothetical protein